VTVCIAAFAKHENKNVIVAVTDTKLSAGGLYSQEMGAMKLISVHKYWGALIAGQYSQHRAICDAIRSELHSIPHPTLGEATAAVTKVYVSETRRFAEECILSRFGLSMAEFLDSRKKIGESLFERTWVEISQVQVGCELLVYGFDQVGLSHIFSVSNPTPDKPTFITEHDHPSFAAIGSGAYVAEGMMYAFGHLSIHNIYETLYHCCVAKFYSETASDVGMLTMTHIIKSDGEFLEHDAMLANHLRNRWGKTGKLKLIQSEVSFIEDSFKQPSKQLTSQKSEGQQ
jgi:hypothetical protein